MKVEHITLGGNAVVRDTESILLETINFLKDFQISQGHKVLRFPTTDLDVKITVTHEGAMFDIMKGNRIAYVNACCFNADQSKGILSFVEQLSKSSMLKTDIIRVPKLPQFIYTVPVDAFSLTPEEMQLAGEVELYIYYSIYLAQKA